MKTKKEVFLLVLLIFSTLTIRLSYGIEIGKAESGKEFKPYFELGLEVEHSLGVEIEEIRAPIAKGEVQDFETEDIKGKVNHSISADVNMIGYLHERVSLELGYVFELDFDYSSSGEDREEIKPDSGLYLAKKKDVVGYGLDVYGIDLKFNLEEKEIGYKTYLNQTIKLGYFEYEPGGLFFSHGNTQVGISWTGKLEMKEELYKKITMTVALGQNAVTFDRPNFIVGFNATLILSPGYEEKSGAPYVNCCRTFSSNSSKEKGKEVYEIGIGIKYFEETMLNLEEVKDYRRAVGEMTRSGTKEWIEKQPEGSEQLIGTIIEDEEATLEGTEGYLIQDYMEAMVYFKMKYERHMAEIASITKIGAGGDFKIGQEIGLVYGYEIIEGKMTGFLNNRLRMPMQGTKELYKTIEVSGEEVGSILERESINYKVSCEVYYYPINEIELTMGVGMTLDHSISKGKEEEGDGLLRIKPFFETGISFKI